MRFLHHRRVFAKAVTPYKYLMTISAAKAPRLSADPTPRIIMMKFISSNVSDVAGLRREMVAFDEGLILNVEND